MTKTPAGTEGSNCSVVYLGLDDFPLGLAQTQNVLLFARSLVEAGCTVTILSRWWSIGEWNKVPDLPSEGVWQGVRYVNACGHLYRPRGFFRRKIVRLRGLYREAATLVRLRRRKSLDAAILSTGIISRVAYYRLLSKLLGFPVILHLVEYYTAYRASGTSGQNLNSRLIDRASLRLVDGVLPISRFLIDRVERYAPGLPWLKDPCLVDLSRFDGLERQPGNRYLVFCGYLGYMELIRFCMEAFERAATDPDVELRLVVNGSKDQFAQLERERAQLGKGDRILILSGITDRELSELYMSAYAMLIPLRPTDQDRARFPHKIGEYCGAARPVITTAIGEVAERFTHGVNAYVVPRYDTADFARAIEEALCDAAGADAVGAAARKLAEEQFDYRLFGPVLKQFIQQVIGSAGTARES